MNATHYPCSRCSGSGKLAGFSHVVGGVCFKCGGSGKQRAKPAAPSTRYVVSLVNRATGAAEPYYTVRAKNEVQALKKARAWAANVSEALRATHDADAVSVVVE